MGYCSSTVSTLYAGTFSTFGYNPYRQYDREDALWKCEHCTTINPYKETLCKWCGAPRKMIDNGNI
jgi:hypothetical protein